MNTTTETTLLETLRGTPAEKLKVLHGSVEHPVILVRYGRNCIIAAYVRSFHKEEHAALAVFNDVGEDTDTGAILKPSK